MKTVLDLQTELRAFSGSMVRYRHALNPHVLYTEGVQFLAEQAGAYWLVDAIASYFGSPKMHRAIANDQRLQDLQLWTLTVASSEGTLLMRADANVTPRIKQSVPWTDFPLPQIDIWAGFDGKHWTLYLPSEH